MVPLASFSYFLAAWIRRYPSEGGNVALGTEGRRTDRARNSRKIDETTN
jgi:hypothetical protein